MTHIRTQIRAAFAALFAADIPGTFVRVEADRVHAIDTERMVPCLDISFSGERIDSRTMGGGGALRVMEFAFGLTATGAGLQDRLDALAVKVEQRVGNNRTLGGLVMYAHVTATAQELSGDGKQRIGRMTVTVQCAVETAENDPENRA